MKFNHTMPNEITNSLTLDGGLIGRPSMDTNKPLMSAEVLADNKDFPEVTNLFWIREYRRGEWPALCYEN